MQHTSWSNTSTPHRQGWPVDLGDTLLQKALGQHTQRICTKRRLKQKDTLPVNPLPFERDNARANANHRDCLLLCSSHNGAAYQLIRQPKDHHPK